MRSIAFPAIGTGQHGFPAEEAAIAALMAVREGLLHGPGPSHVVFALPDENTRSIFRRVAILYLEP
jgi:O-acetyl-ADP-ribose deacetylase (regulator of RNase III)